MRLFVGLVPPPAALEDLAAACAPVRPGRTEPRWTSPELWHVTLAFLGEVRDDRLDGLVPRLEDAARRHARVGLSLAGAGAFPSAERANVLWAGLSGDLKALGELAVSVSAEARLAGASGEGRAPDTGHPFRPHVTLARCRPPVDVAALAARLGGYQGPAWAAEEIYLIRSRPGGQPHYETIGTWKLDRS